MKRREIKISASMLASTTTLLVDTKEFITGRVIGCNAEGSTAEKMTQVHCTIIFSITHPTIGSWVHCPKQKVATFRYSIIPS